MKKDDGAYVNTVPDLAKALGRTWQSLYRFEKKGVFSKSQKGYNVEECRLALSKDGSQEGKKWDVELKKYKALGAKLEFLKERKKLVYRSQVLEAQKKRDLAFKQKMLRLKYDLPQQLIGLSQQDMMPIIEEHVIRALNLLTESNAPSS